MKPSPFYENQGSSYEQPMEPIRNVPNMPHIARPNDPWPGDPEEHVLHRIATQRRAALAKNARLRELVARIEGAMFYLDPTVGETLGMALDEIDETVQEMRKELDG